MIIRRDMHFAVTGGAGFVGSNLVKLLVKEGHEIIVIDNLDKGKKENLASVINKIKFQKMDIRDYESMKKILKNVDGVFHQAALTIVQDSITIVFSSGMMLKSSSEIVLLSIDNEPCFTLFLNNPTFCAVS